MMDIEQGKYFSLNPVATRVWDLLEVEMSAEELCGHLTEEYDVDSYSVQGRGQALLEDMVRLGLTGQVTLRSAKIFTAFVLIAS